MKFKNLAITCEGSGPIPKTRVIIDGVDFSGNMTEIRFSHKAGCPPSLLLDIALKGMDSSETK